MTGKSGTNSLETNDQDKIFKLIAGSFFKICFMAINFFLQAPLIKKSAYLTLCYTQNWVFIFLCIPDWHHGGPVRGGPGVAGPPRPAHGRLRLLHGSRLAGLPPHAGDQVRRH